MTDFITRLVADVDSRQIGYAIVVHDPDIDDYVVGPFPVRKEAEEYAEGSLMLIGPDGAAFVVEMELPHDPKEMMK